MKIEYHNNLTRPLTGKFSTEYPHLRQLLAKKGQGSGSRANSLGGRLSYAVLPMRVVSGNTSSWKTCQLELRTTQQTATHL